VSSTKPCEGIQEVDLGVLEALEVLEVLEAPEHLGPKELIH